MTTKDPTDTRRVPSVWATLTVWLGAWFVAQVAVASVIQAAGGRDGDRLPIPVLALGSATQWAVFVTAIVWYSRLHRTGNVMRDYAVRFRVGHLIGLPVGAITQVVLIPVVYVPLRGLWPGVFSDQRLEQRASDLTERAGGLTALLLIAIVGFGAPFFEELTYRGFLQQNIAARTRQLVAVHGVAALFTFVHLTPVEYPGLAVIALVLGASAVVANELGFPIAVHVGFNVTGLILAWR